MNAKNIIFQRSENSIPIPTKIIKKYFDAEVLINYDFKTHFDCFYINMLDISRAIKLIPNKRP